MKSENYCIPCADQKILTPTWNGEFHLPDVSYSNILIKIKMEKMYQT